MKLPLATPLTRASRFNNINTRSYLGLTENDGHENDGPSKLQDMKLQDVKLTDMKLQDMKMMDQVAGHEILRRHLFLRFVASLEILP